MAVEENVTFTTKEDATKILSECYRSFYKENVGGHFSERSFSHKINVSSSILNDLRNGHKKVVEPATAMKVLKGIGREDLMASMLKTLSPGIHKVLYAFTRPSENQFAKIEENDELMELANLYTSKTYGHILSVIFADLNVEVTVEDINSISSNEEKLKSLEEKGILEISDGIVKPSKKIKDLLGDRGIQLSPRKVVEQAELFLNIFDPYALEENKKFGHHSTLTALLNEKNTFKLLVMFEDFRKTVCDFILENSGGDIRVGIALLLTPLLYRADNDNKDAAINNNEENKGVIQ